MQTDSKQDESLSPEIQDVMKNLISAIRVVKIYPANNPIYSQSVKKCHDALAHILQTETEYHVGVQKNYFTYGQTPFAKDTQVNRAIVQDLFAKGIREIIFSAGQTEAELLELCQALALSSEELAMRSGISTILWEKGAIHIKVTESGLDEVITTEGSWESTTKAGTTSEQDGITSMSKKEASARTLVLGEVKTDPVGFGASMVEFAKRTRVEHETLEDRLFTLYQQAGHKIHKDHPQESDALFEGLAESVLSLESPHREALIAGKLYADLDNEIAADQEARDEQIIPNALHEIRTGRFSNSWTVQQVSMLLKKSASKKIAPPTPPPNPEQLQTVPVSGDLTEVVRSLENENPEHEKTLKSISDSGMESDIIEAAVRTLISLIPMVKNPSRTGPAEKDVALFSGVVHQLEDMLSYLLKKNNYDLATIIIRALHMQVDPEFQPRMMEALKKTATKTIIKETITNMRKYAKGSSEYVAAYTYLSSLGRKAIEALLELLAEENERSVRIYLLDLLKDFGKNQTALLADYLTDERWYVVRNIVSILAESKTDQAVVMLRKAADHRNIKIRLEVIKALISIGGKKAAGVLAKFLRDQDASIQMTAIHAFPEIPGLGAEEARPLVEFLEERPLNKKDQELTLATIKTLGRIGGGEAALFLERYKRIRWWKSRKLQMELRNAAARSIEEISRREGDGGPAKR